MYFRILTRLLPLSPLHTPTAFVNVAGRTELAWVAADASFEVFPGIVLGFFTDMKQQMVSQFLENFSGTCQRAVSPDSAYAGNITAIAGDEVGAIGSY